MRWMDSISSRTSRHTHGVCLSEKFAESPANSVHERRDFVQVFCRISRQSDFFAVLYPWYLMERMGAWAHGRMGT